MNDQFLEIYRRCFTENFAEPSLKIIGGGKMARILVDGFLKAGNYYFKFLRIWKEIYFVMVLISLYQAFLFKDVF